MERNIEKSRGKHAGRKHKLQPRGRGQAEDTMRALHLGVEISNKFMLNSIPQLSSNRASPQTAQVLQIEKKGNKWGVLSGVGFLLCCSVPEVNDVKMSKANRNKSEKVRMA